MTSRARTSTTAPQEDGDLSEAAGSPHRARILKAALALLSTGGRDALTTRAVSEAAGVQPPVLYRLFHDKRGLLDAVAQYGFSLYLSEKREPHPTENPIQFLREGWARHVHFGLTHPELYLLMYADPHLTAARGSTQHAYPGLRRQMQIIAAAGSLRLPVDRAADVFHAAASGVVMNLLSRAEQDRDMALSQVLCEAALASILVDPPISPDSTIVVAANTLRAQLLDASGLPEPASELFTAPEKALLLEWLARLTGQL